MIGAILVAGFVAAMSTVCATLSNFAIARQLSEIGAGFEADLPQPLFVRITCYRFVAKVFHRQAQFFWILCGSLAVVELLLRTNLL
jgi:hypothetical protein